ncbi:hypothetical protein GH714_007790 [Hevea brasiliensis]|uniref:Pectate lyase superfamily protein domain-containing protein n=1 Tax=Hevea brasiliensis TaxID=3981 RepID=A0A6A6MV54_HEVBR|nr:hypothetical protein GH714_007790 [Hevea brasiliensis]
MQGAMHLEVQGTFIAPTSPNAHNKASWITFAYIDRLTISGGGTFDGRGEIAWKQNNCGQNPKCKSLQLALQWKSNAFTFLTQSKKELARDRKHINKEDGFKDTCIRNIFGVIFFDASGAQSNTFDVRKYGARADARSDISKALLSAWKEACAAVGSSKIMIPKGTYLQGVVDLKGPCKGAMHLEVQGTFIAPTSPNAHNKASWITFAYIIRLTISGGGTFGTRRNCLEAK